MSKIQLGGEIFIALLLPFERPSTRKSTLQRISPPHLINIREHGTAINQGIPKFMLFTTRNAAHSETTTLDKLKHLTSEAVYRDKKVTHKQSTIHLVYAQPTYQTLLNMSKTLGERDQPRSGGPSPSGLTSPLEAPLESVDGESLGLISLHTIS
ncbi:MAG: hypothetical protein ABJQ14_15650 [Hyphomicrobiales bacterium]